MHSIQYSLLRFLRSLRSPVRPGRQRPRHGLHAASIPENLEKRLLLTTATVDDDYLGIAIGDPVDGGIFGTDRFATVSDAVAALTDGDSIQVQPGAYAESVVIKDNLAVTGVGDASQIIIDPPDTEPGIEVKKNASVAISNLTVTGAQDGIKAKAGTLSVSNVVLTGNFRDGLRVTQAAIVAATDLTATGNAGHGLRLRKSDSVSLTGGTEATGNVGNGLDVRNSGSVSVDGGEFSGLRATDVASFTTGMHRVSTSRDVQIAARDSVDLNGELDAGSASVSIMANVDGDSDGSFTMASDATIVTTRDEPNAVHVSVNSLMGGTNPATLGVIQAGTTPGVGGGLVKVVAEGGAVLDGNGSEPNVVAGNAILAGMSGVGDYLGNPLSPNAIETMVVHLEAAGGTGGVYVENEGSLTIGVGPMGYSGVGSDTATATADVRIIASSPLTVTEDIISGGKVELVASESTPVGDDLTVTAGALVRAHGGPVHMTAGDDVRVDVGTLIESLHSSVLIEGDDGNFDDGVGTTIHIDGVINSVTGALILGGPDSDEINITAAGSGGMIIGGQAGDDRFHVTYPGGDTFKSALTIDDMGGGNDRATVYGTAGADEFYYTSDDPPTTLETDQITRGTPTDEPIILQDNLEHVTLAMNDGNDIAHVQPTNLFEVLIDGGSPCFGDPGVPPGDTLEFLPGGREFELLDAAFRTMDGSENYPPLHFTGIESLPVGPMGTGAPLRFDFNHTHTSANEIISATQPGYVGVQYETLYSDGLGYGWQSAVASFGYEDDFYTGPQADLIKDGNRFNDEATLTIDVPTTGYYLVSMLFGSPFTGISNTKIRNQDTMHELLEGIETVAGESADVSIVAYVEDGTLDLTFINARAHPTIFGINAMTVQPANLITMGLDTCSTGPLVADGVSIETFPLSGAEPFGYVTVSATMGEIVNTDADPELRGVQVQADATGTLDVLFRRPFGIGTGVITLADVVGRGLGFATLEFIPPYQRRFDMNHFNDLAMDVPSPTQDPIASPAEPDGFIGVLPSQLYSPGSGFGWETEPGSFDRGSELLSDPRDELKRDGASDNLSNAFYVELPDDRYDVTVTLGMLRRLAGIRLKANGSTVLSGGAVEAGEHIQSTFQVDVTDGLLSVEVGANELPRIWAINSIEIRSVNLVTPIEFEPGPGMQPADGLTTSTVTVKTEADEGEQLTVWTTLGTIVTPDVNHEHQGVQVTVPASGVVSFDILAPAVSGTPELRVLSVDGKHQGSIFDSTWLSWFVPHARRFDFNHVHNGANQIESPTAAGAIGATRLDRTAEVAGYGWAVAPGSYHTTLATESNSTLVTDLAMHEDFAMGHRDSGGRTFRVQVKPETSYDLTVFAGAFHKNQSIRVRVEGVAAEQSLTTLATAFGSLEFFGARDTTGDGYLDISFGSGSEVLPLWMVNGFDIAEAP